MDVAKINPSEHRRALKAAAGDVRNMDDTSLALAAWLEGRIGSDVTVSNLRMPTGAGIANETLLFDSRYTAGGEQKTRGLVARVKPIAVQLFPDPDFHGLFRLLDVLNKNDLVKVPEPLWLEDDPAVIGAPFFVMSRIEGRTPVSQPPYNKQGWLADARPADRHTAWTTAIEGMASVHRVPGDLVSFIGWPQYGPTGEDQQLGYWENYASWAEVPLPENLTELGGWVRANRPQDPGIHLSWGDARLGNMMFGTDFRLAAVLDWDQMSLGNPLHDLAWWLFFDKQYSEGLGISRLVGLGDRADTIALWEEKSGLNAENLSWYEAYAAYKVGLITMKTLISGGQSYEDATGLVDRFVSLGRSAVDA